MSDGWCLALGRVLPLRIARAVVEARQARAEEVVGRELGRVPEGAPVAALGIEAAAGERDHGPAAALHGHVRREDPEVGVAEAGVLAGRRRAEKLRCLQQPCVLRVFPLRGEAHGRATEPAVVGPPTANTAREFLVAAAATAATTTTTLASTRSLVVGRGGVER